MDTEVIAWTLVFLGGDLLIVLALIGFAVKKDREKSREQREAASSDG